MSDITTPRYAELSGSCTYRPPFMQKNCVARAYVLPAKRDVLQKHVDEWLNRPMNEVFDYVALPWVSLMTMSIAEAASLNPQDAHKGYSQETDFGFCVMLAAMRSGVVDHFCIGFPFILVDNPITLVTGREVYGYRKAFGVYDYLPDTLLPIRAQTYVMPKYAPTEQQQLKEIMRMHDLVDDLALAQGHSLPTDLLADVEHLFAKGLEDVESFVEKLKDKLIGDAAKWALRNIPDARLLLKQFLKFASRFRSIPVAFLQQLRDIESCDLAAYEAVVESPMVFTSFESVNRITPPKITLTEYPSYRFITDLGLHCENGGTVTPLMGFEAKFSFRQDTGRIIAEGGRILEELSRHGAYVSK